MIHLTVFDALIIEQEMRTDRANRYGWMRADTADSPRSGRFGAVLNALVAFLPGKNSSRKIEPVSTSDVPATATSQTQGVM